MNLILVLCLAVLSVGTYAAPGLLPAANGYNYQQNQVQQQYQQPQFQQPQQQSVGNFVGQQASNVVPGLSGVSTNFGGSNGLAAAGNSPSFGAINLGSNNQQHNHQVQHHQQQQQLAPIVTKDIFVHSAPEEPEEEYQQNIINSQPLRKHYRIIFIKAPAQSSKSAAIRLAQAHAQTEEKTVIYVLSKKTDAADIQAAIQAAPVHQPSKPEVFFIKYKTQEEARHAQQQIQAQYDSLGGTSQISDEGIAPITSVIGSLGQNGNGGNQINNGGAASSNSFSGSAPEVRFASASLSSSSNNGGGGNIVASNSAYLPPNHN